jgi:hypothetical protein
MNINKEQIQEDLKSIKKFPLLFILTVITLVVPISIGIWLFMKNIIYNPRLENYESIIRLKNESIDKLKADYGNLIRLKDTIRINDTIRIPEEKVRHISQPNTQPPVQINGNNAVVSQGQFGGQTANTIYNQQPVARTIANYRLKLIEELNKIEPIDYEIQVLANDMESWNLAAEIKDAFESAGWSKKAIIKGYGGIYPPGFTVCRDKATKQSEDITVLLSEAGLKGTLVDDFKKKCCNKIEIFIGPNPDNYSNTKMPEAHLVPREFK